MPRRLETARLVLTPQTEDDVGWFTELLDTRGTGPHTEHDARERIARARQRLEDHGLAVLVLRVRPDGDPVGYCGVVVGRGTLDEPELAYELLPRAHGRGLATEAAAAVLEAALGTGRPRIWATVGSWNAPSLRVLAKLGFTEHHRSVEHEAGEVVWLVRER